MDVEIEEAPPLESAVGSFFAKWRAFSSFQHRDYRYFWTGNVSAFTAMSMQQVAQGWLVFSLTESALLLGLVSFMVTLPIFVLSLVGGAVADRMEKRRLIHITQFINMVSILALGILTSTGLIQVWHVFVTAFLSGSAMAFNAPARQAFVVELVGRRNLMNAIALNSSGMNITRMFGPALGGVLISAIGVSGAFYINATCYAIAIATLIPMQITGKPVAQNRSMWNNLVEGLRYVRQNDMIMALMGLVAVPTIFGMSYQMLMPVFADEVLGVGATGLGLLMGGNGAGALVGSLALAFAGDFERRGRVLIGAAVGFGTSVVLFALTTAFMPAVFALAMAAIVAVGCANVVFMATTNTLLQIMSPDELRGRVMSVFMLTWGLMPLGTLPAGAVASSFGAPVAVGAGGLICLVFVLLLTVRQPKLWRLS